MLIPISIKKSTVKSQTDTLRQGLESGRVISQPCSVFAKIGRVWDSYLTGKIIN